MWRLGDHILVCGDATDPDTVRRLASDSRIDIAITSPPYGVSNSAALRDHYVKGSAKRKTLYKTHKDKKDQWRDLITSSMDCMREVSDAQFVNIQMLAENKNNLIDILAAYNSCLCDIIVWDKQKAPPQMQGCVLNNEFEFVFVFGKEGASRAIPFSDFHGNVSNVLHIMTGNNEFADVHRAVYPVQLPANLLAMASKADTVLDPFGGTGTTMIACEQLGRKCRMIELDPAYCDVIIARWEKFTGQKAVLTDG